MEKEKFCLACFNAQYPMKHPHQLHMHMQAGSPKFALESPDTKNGDPSQSDRPRGLDG
jgi:hypothetical protein